MTVPEVLRAAAQGVRQGWCQNQLQIGFDRCAIGWVLYVLDTRSRYGFIQRSLLETNVRAAVINALALPERIEVWPDGYREKRCPIPAWNDAPGQTAENVALGLEYSAIHYELTHPAPALPAPDQELVTC